MKEEELISDRIPLIQTELNLVICYLDFFPLSVYSDIDAMLLLLALYFHNFDYSFIQIITGNNT